MSDLERLLGESFDAAARASVPDTAAPPPARFTGRPAERRRGHRLAPLAAAAAVAAVGASVLVLHGGGGGHRQPPAAVGAAVHIKLATAGARSYGVGMPVVAYFSRRFTTAQPLASATRVTVNGTRVRAAWYFERSAVQGYPIEGHLRMRTFWPAHSAVQVSIAANKLTQAASVAFHTGSRTIAIVDDRKHDMIVTRDGKPIGSYPVALGAAATPTTSGIKVIMQKDASVCLSGPAFHECGVKYAQQLTYSGEYLHAAPWNTTNIKVGRDTSNGCTNLLPNDAAVLYKTLIVGDVVEYPDAPGPPMQLDAGYGDWNVPWRTWQRGGLIPTG